MTGDPGTERRGGFFLHVVPAILYIAAIFYGGTAPANTMPGPDIQFGDKLMHAVAFGILVIVLRRAVGWFVPTFSPRTILIASALLSAGIGGVLELVQMMTASRAAELADFLADAFGAFVTAMVLDRLAASAVAR